MFESICFYERDIVAILMILPWRNSSNNLLYSENHVILHPQNGDFIRYKY